MMGQQEELGGTTLVPQEAALESGNRCRAQEMGHWCFQTVRKVCTPLSFLLFCQIVLIFTATECSKNNFIFKIIIVIA